MNADQFVPEIFESANNYETGSNTHFGKILERLKQSPNDFQHTILLCLSTLARCIYGDQTASTITQRIGETFGYTAGMSPSSPPPIGPAGISEIGIKFLDWCHDANLIRMQKVYLEDGAHRTWTCVPTKRFQACVEDCFEVVSRLPIDQGPNLWTRPVMMRNGVVAEIVKRAKSSSMLSYYTPERIPEVYESLNRSNSLEWKINEHAFNIMKSAANDNPFLPEAIHEDELAATKKGLSDKKWQANSYRKFMLEKVLTDDTMDASTIMKIAVGATNKYFKARDESYRTVISKWDKQSVFNKVLSLAEVYYDKTLTYTFVLDSRGRQYTSSFPHLEPLGSDQAKALLCYNKEEYVDPYNLAISTATAFGHKGLLEERVEWCNENMDMLRAIGEDPWAHIDYLVSIGLHNEKKDKWQALVLANVWTKLNDWVNDGNHIDTFKSDVPVPRDGSCQGLQILSMLSLDEWAGPMVNVATCYDDKGDETVGDIYQYVGNFIPDALDALPDDKQTDTLIAFNEQLRANPKYRRKVAKRNTMTKAYNSKRFGFGKQHTQDKDTEYGFEEAVALTNKDCFTLGGTIYDIVSTRLPKASGMMDWMVDGIDELPDCNPSVIKWTLPDGFTAFADKGTTRTVMSKGTIGPHKITLALLVPTGLIDASKHKLAVAPNIVHSIDAYILREIVRNMPIGAPISTVHDSFSTASCYIDDLVDIARQAYKDATNRDMFKAMCDDCFKTDRALPTPGNLSPDDIDDTNLFIS